MKRKKACVGICLPGAAAVLLAVWLLLPEREGRQAAESKEQSQFPLCSATETVSLKESADEIQIPEELRALLERNP